MEVVVLDYTDGSVTVLETPEKMESEQIEEWLDSLGYDVSDCCYMAAAKVQIRDKRRLSK